MGTTAKPVDAVSARLAEALKKTQRTFPHQQARPGGSAAVAARTSGLNSAQSVSDRLGALAKAAQRKARAAKHNGVNDSVAETDAFSERLAELLKDGADKAASGTEQESSEAASEDSGGPVGTGDHLVKQGECVSSIAKETGHFWKTIWEDAGNTELREVRQAPNVLLEEDRVTVPPIETKQESGATEMRHRFVRLGEPSKLSMRVRDHRGPRVNEPFRLEIDDWSCEGITDADGKIECAIPGDAQKGTLTVGEGSRQMRVSVRLGTVDPVSTTSGVQARLRNLGFKCGPADGELNARTRGALEAFQKLHGLTITGEPDDATRDKLKQEHGT